MANGTEVKSWRRGLSLLLAFVMLLSCVNLEAFAQEYDGDIFIEEPVIQEEEPALFEETVPEENDEFLLEEEWQTQQTELEETDCWQELPSEPAGEITEEPVETAAEESSEQAVEEFFVSDSESFEISTEKWYGTWAELATRFTGEPKSSIVSLQKDVIAQPGDAPLRITNKVNLDLNGHTLDGSALDADYAVIAENAVIADYYSTGRILGGRKARILVTGKCGIGGMNLTDGEVGIVLDGDEIYMAGMPVMNVLRVLKGTLELNGNPVVRKRIELADVSSGNVTLKAPYRLSGSFNLAVEGLDNAPGSETAVSAPGFLASEKQFSIIGSFDSATGITTESGGWSAVRTAGGCLGAVRNYEIKLLSDDGQSRTDWVFPGKDYVLPECPFYRPIGRDFRAWKRAGDWKSMQPGEKIENVSGNMSFRVDWASRRGKTVEVLTTQNGHVDLEWHIGGPDWASVEKNRPVAAGGELRLEICPDAGYMLNALTVWTKDDNTPIRLSRNCLWYGEYTEAEFTMPEEDVVVIPEFRPIRDGLSLALPLADDTEITLPDGLETLQITARDGMESGRTVLTLNAPQDKGILLNGLANSLDGGKSFLKVQDTTYTSEDKPVNAVSDTLRLELNLEAPQQMELDLVLETGALAPVRFEANGGSGSMPDTWALSGRAYTLPPCAFEAPAGRIFGGWLTPNGAILTPGEKITVGDNTLLRATWNPDWGRLQTMLYAANDGDTIVLDADYEAGGEKNLLITGSRTLTIDLNGHVLDRNWTEALVARDGGIFSVMSPATLILKDSSADKTGLITGGCTYDAGAVDVFGTFIMEGGCITGNKSVQNGGAVCVCQGGVMKLRGGTITMNEAVKNGGGVFVKNGGRLEISGGELYYNVAKVNGGGVYVDNGGTVSISGGRLSANNADVGAGIYLAPGAALTLNGGEITNNEAERNGGGIWAGASTALIQLSGAPRVCSNWKGQAESSDLALSGGALITLTGKLSGDARLDLDAAAGVVAEGYAQEEPIEKWFFTPVGALYRRESRVILETEHVSAEAPVWHWKGRSAEAEMLCANCGASLWTDNAAVSGPVWDEDKLAPVFVGVAAHGGKSYTDRHACEGTLTFVERVEPEVSESGRYIPGTEAYYSFKAQSGETWLFTVGTDGQPDAQIDAPQSLSYFVFRDSAIVRYTGPFEAEGETAIELPESDGETVFTVIGDGTNAFYSAPAGSAVVIECSDSIETVAPNAFHGLESLVDFTGDTGSLTKIGSKAFLGSSVTELRLDAEEAVTIASDGLAAGSTVLALHASKLGEGAHGSYNVLYTDHEYTVVHDLTVWDGDKPSITIRCWKDSCANTFTLDATVKQETVEGRTVRIATASFEGKEYTDQQNNFEIILKAGSAAGTDQKLTGTASYTLPEKAEFFAPKAGMALTGWKDEAGRDYAPGENLSLDKNKTFTAQWQSTWGEVNKVLQSGGTVTLQNDITALPEDGSLTVPAGKTATLLLDGYTVDRGLTAPVVAGSVFRVDGTLNLDGGGGTVKGGYTQGAGGAVWVNEGGSFNVYETSIQNNQANDNGGALNLGKNSRCTIVNTVITLNTARGYGGGAYMDTGSYCYIGGGSNAKARFTSGAVAGNLTFSENESFLSPRNGVGINRTSITGNTSFKKGGGFYKNGGKMELADDVSILDNTTSSESGMGENFDNVSVPDAELGDLGNSLLIAEAGLKAAETIGISKAAYIALGSVAAVAAGGLLTYFIVDAARSGNEKQKDKQQKCSHDYETLSLTWDESSYEFAMAQNVCKKCGKTETKKVESEATLDEDTQVWTYTIKSHNKQETRETKPYIVTMQPGLTALRQTLEQAEDQQAKEILEKLKPIQAENVVYKIAHKQGKSGSFTLPDGLWQSLLELYSFGGWLMLDGGTQVLKKDAVREITKDTQYEQVLECSVTYEHTPRTTTQEEGAVPPPAKVRCGGTYNLRKNDWTREQFNFNGWKVVMGGILLNEGWGLSGQTTEYLEFLEKGMDEGTPVKVYANTVVTAQWKSKWSALNDRMGKKDPTVAEVLKEDLFAMEGDKSLTVMLLSGAFALNLNGHQLNRSWGGSTLGELAEGSVLKVQGPLSLSDTGEPAAGQPGGSVTMGRAKGDNGGGINMPDNGGRLAMSGGTITLNEASYLSDTGKGGNGGGVAMTAQVPIDRKLPKFILEKGNILSNTADINGGGVYAGANSYFKMTGGAISSNSATWAEQNKDKNPGNGGGVYVDKSALFEISGGTITQNTAARSGGGVYMAGTMEISGKFTITDNSGGNVYLCKDKVMTVTGKLDPETRVGVTTEVKPTAENPVVLTKGLKDKGSVENFVSDDEKYTVLINDEGEAVLCLPVTITFEKGDEGASGSMPSVSVPSNVRYALPENGFTAPAGKGFDGWAVAIGEMPAVEMNPGEPFMPIENTVVTARWKKLVTVTFDSDGGSPVEAQTVLEGSYAREPENPTKDGYTFVNWLLGDQVFSFATPITQDITLKADWAEGRIPAFRKHSLVLSGQIGLNFFLDLPPIDGVNYSESYITFNIKGNRTARANFNPNFRNQDGSLYGFTCYLTSIEMADPITATFHYGDGGEIQEVYSIQQYVEEFNAIGGAPYEVQRLVDSLADYGHYYQTFLAITNKWKLGDDGLHRHMPAASLINEERIDMTRENSAAYAMVKNLGESQIKDVTYGLMLASETTLYLNLTMKEGYKGGTPVAKIGNRNLKVGRRPDGRYRVMIPNIKASELGTTYQVSITADKECTVNISAMSYVNTVLTDHGTLDESVIPAVTALYQYYEAAREYTN